VYGSVMEIEYIGEHVISFPCTVHWPIDHEAHLIMVRCKQFGSTAIP
jgi:hypothetical protein